MFETDRLPSGWSARLNTMDEVWVPTSFHADVFVRGGVAASKVVVVPEAVDSAFFNPARVTSHPRDLSAYGIELDHVGYRFLSVFKWEYRKGWDVLLTAFLTQFEDTDYVWLYILTSSYHSTARFQEEIDTFVTSSLPAHAHKTGLRSRIRLVATVPQELLPWVYGCMDALVLPSRGEGWGRPHVEAMAMALPVIATNWSGPVEYMTAANSYPLKFDGFKPIPSGAFAGHLMAEPSSDHLQMLMRELFTNPMAGRAKGEAARASMLAWYTPARLAKYVRLQLTRVQLQLVARAAGAAAGDEGREL